MPSAPTSIPPPVFFKLHLEGAEHDALLGGLATIRHHRPIIAATVYHDADGLYRTARLMMTALEDYRFLFRLHAGAGQGPWSMRCRGRPVHEHSGYRRSDGSRRPDP